MKQLLVASLQKALNCYLALDPESKQRLHVLQGKVVQIELLKVGVVIQLVFTQTAVHLKADQSIEADTVIKGTPFRLLHMSLSRDNRQKFFADDVSITGNVELGKQVIELFDHLEIDWEEHLSQWIGDVPAHYFGRMGRQLKSWSRQTRQTLLQDVNEYVHEEINLFPPREALQDFFQEVDVLRMDVDRIEARLQHLLKQLKDARQSHGK